MARLRFRLLLAVSLAAALVAAGCGGADPVPVPAGNVSVTTGSVPASAALAPADATAFVTVVSDPSSKQWADAALLIDLVPGARSALDGAVRSALERENLTWEQDVKPALGPELLVVVTKTNRPVLLMQTEQPDKLRSLIEAGGGSAVVSEQDGWTVVTEKAEHADEYRAALAQGSLDADAAFRSAMEALPGDALARAYVNGANVTEALGEVIKGSGTDVNVKLGVISAALALQDGGVLIRATVETPDGDLGTSYEPQLFKRVPGDALVALSFGGTQTAVDKLRQSVDLEQMSKQVEEVTGLSIDGLIDLFSGEGVLYVREGAAIPEVTLALAPGDLDRAWESVDGIIRSVAESMSSEITTTEQNGVEVHKLAAGSDVNVSYARLADAVIVTTGASGIRLFSEDGDKLAQNEHFLRAAETVGLGDRTSGFLYVDVDGLVPLIEGILDTTDATLPDDARKAIEAFDSVILQGSGDGKQTTLSGFVRMTGR